MPRIIGTVTDDGSTKTTTYTGNVTNNNQNFYFDEKQDGMILTNNGTTTINLTVNSRSYIIMANNSIRIDEKLESFNIMRNSPGSHTFTITTYLFHNGSGSIPGIPKPDWVVEDNLTSTNTKSALSANQGRILNAQLSAKAPQSALNITNANVSANTSAITTNTTAITNIGNASPKGVYATLTALQTAFPTGTTGVYVVAADGKWYYWNGSSWTTGGTYQATAIADASISPSMTSFGVSTLNKFNKDSSSNIPGQTLDSVSGAQSADATRFITHFIDVTAYVGKPIGTFYFVGASLNSTFTFFYDTNKTFISSANGTSNVPANAVYVRARPPIANMSDVMVWVGTTNPTAFVPFSNVDATKIYYGNKTITSITDDLTTKINTPISPAKTDFYTGTFNLFNKDSLNTISGSGLDTSGNQTVDATRFTSEYINVSSYVGKTVGTYYFNGGILQGTSTYFYDVNKAFISSGIGGQTVPSNAVYTRFTHLLTNINIMMFWVGATNPTQYVPFALVDGAKILVNNQSLPDALKNVSTTFSNKKWTSFGDSITEMNMWQPYVINALGMVHTNRGVGGTCIAGDTTDIGGGVIRYSMNRDERISLIPLDTEVITIMGGSNDWGQSRPIGVWGDTTNATFYGAYKITLDKIYSRIPNARVIIMSPPYRENEESSPISGQYLDQFRTAIRDIAYRYSYQLIDHKANCGINSLNKATYLQDVVHPNDAGGKRMAEVVIGALKAIQPTV